MAHDRDRSHATSQAPGRVEPAQAGLGELQAAGRIERWAPVALAALGAALYLNALNNEFLFDDIAIILSDPRVQQGRIGELLTGNYWFLPSADRLYRPLVSTSYALNWALSKEPWAFRLPNLLIYAATCVVVFQLAREVFGSLAVGLIAGVFFAVHPIHTEPLNPIIGRADLAATLLMLLAAWLTWRDGSGAARGWRGPLLATACFAAALGCKENAITLIGLVALLDWWRWQADPTGREPQWLRRRILRAYLPMILISLGYLVARRLAVGTIVNDPSFIDPWDNPIARPTHYLADGDSVWLARWATPLAVFAKAAGLLVWPAHLCYDYSYKAIELVGRVRDARLWCGLGWLALLALAAWASYRRRRAVLLAIGFALIPYSLVSNIPIVIGTIFGERLLYTPSVGVCMLAGALGGAWLRRFREDPRRTVRLATGLGLAALALAAVGSAARTILRNRDWRTNETVALAAAKVNPTSCKVLAALAAKAINDQRFELALRYCKQAIEIAPGYWPPWRTAGGAYMRTGRNDLALKYFVQALRRGAGADPPTALSASRLLVERGNYYDAIKILRTLVRYRPDSLLAQNNLAVYLIEAKPPSLRDPREALDHARKALAMAPCNGSVLDTYVQVLLALGRTDQARTVLQQRLGMLRPDDPYLAPLRRKLETLQKSSAGSS